MTAPGFTGWAEVGRIAARLAWASGRPRGAGAAPPGLMVMIVLVRVHQAVDMDHEIAHLRLVDGGLGLGLPGFAGFGEIGVHADKIELGKVLERDLLGGFQLAAENKMQQLLGLSHGVSLALFPWRGFSLRVARS